VIASIAEIFKYDWMIMSVIIPTTRYVPNRSCARTAIRYPCNVKSKYNRTIILEPTNPNSSAATAKIESPIGSGKKLNFWIL
jgi:hypothetical protein